MLNSKNRAYLRGLANALTPLFQVGKGGVSEEMCRQIANCLAARELIKLRVLENSGESARDAAEAIAAATDSDVVCVVGNRFVLYRQAEEPEKRKIVLPC